MADAAPTIDDFADLPPFLAEVARLVGREKALEIAVARGGTVSHLPSEPIESHWLVKLIGPDDARSICQHFTLGIGRVQLEIPFGPDGPYLTERRRRARMVESAADDGSSVNEIARLAGITSRSVRRQLSKRRALARRAALNPKGPLS